MSGDVMPKEQYDFIKGIQDYMLEATNMKEREAWDFAFRIWQSKGWLFNYMTIEVSEKQVTGKLKNADDSLLTADSDSRKEQKSKLESDTISRQAAINAIENTDVEITAEEWDELTNAIESLPPANTDLSDYIDRLWKIAYERGKSERPKGEWFIREYEYFTCDQCGGDVESYAESTQEARNMLENGEYPDYCPNCGSYNGGGK